MATIGEGSPDARDTRIAPPGARPAGDSGRAVPTPWWYFLVGAALFAALVLAQLLGEHATTAQTVAGTVIVVLVLALSRRSGVVAGPISRNRGWQASVALVFVTVLGSLAWFEATGQAWTVVLCAAIVAALVLAGGWSYRRNPS